MDDVSRKSVSFFVSKDGGNTFSGSSINFTYTDMYVTSIEPNVGSESGGTSVVVRGGDFFAGEDVRCLFGGIEASSTALISKNELLCISPALPAGIVDVEVSHGGIDSTSSKVKFRYIINPVVAIISPTFGPTTGGSQLRIVGDGFPRRRIWLVSLKTC